jgi:hypothetical protein
MRFFRFLFGWWGAGTGIAGVYAVPIAATYNTTAPIRGGYNPRIHIAATYNTVTVVKGIK